MKYKSLNRIMGWLVFVVAAITYCLTIEPTASFWDCPEFILSGHKLEVGHPPGAPFFMLTANLFSQFASDTSKVAMMVNIMSALLSALCILFLFWTITYLVKKLVCGKCEPDVWQKLLILGSGVVGALAYTWSDTFWFSAVEGEVYGYSSFCTAVTFWLILKWEESCEEPHSSRWLVLIAYTIGVSVGVHLLNLLCITAIVLVYYFKKAEKPTLKGGIFAFCFSGLIIAAVLYGMVPGIVKVGGWFELLFVNVMGLSFNTGLITYVILLVAAIIWGVYESQRGENKNRMYLSFLTALTLTGMPFYGHTTGGVVFGILIVLAAGVYLMGGVVKESYKPKAWLLNTVMLCVMMITIGYSSYALIVIRSTANPPMDQNSPEDVFSLGDYLAREQYGSRPLFYGQTYASQMALKVEKNYCSPIYKVTGKTWGRKEKENSSEKDSYYVVDEKRSYKYAQNMLFPRMYSPDSKHIEEYKVWCGGIKGKTVMYDNCGKRVKLTIPTQMENLKFFFRYQVNFMYWRYFMWNFVGRQNDIPGYGEAEHGNWITGVNFIDSKLIGGDQRLLPESLKGKGRNVFYALPLILGLLGIFWQCGKKQEGTRQFFVVFTLFFMTGLAIVIYLNQTPQQPRERDYAYAGSFYAFAIWIGMGVVALAELLKKLLGGKLSAVVACVAALFVPIQMVGQTWDDHDRSNRYTCRDFGKNYLRSLPEEGNPIIFCCGDNDTFPLWYNVETEGFRTDVRVCNLSYLATDWYIDQMRRPAYGSPALPISFTRLEYQSGTNDYVEIHPEYKQTILKEAKTPEERERAYENFEVNYVLDTWIKKGKVVPTDTIWLRIDKDAVLASGMMIPKEYQGTTIEETKALMPDKMYISLKGKRYLMKHEIMMLDIIAKCNWERPIYVASSVSSSNYIDVQSYLLSEGIVQRITPFDYKKLGYNKKTSLGTIADTEKMYKNLMSYEFGGLDHDDLYLDETVRRMSMAHRRLFAELALALMEEGKNDKALEVLDKIESSISVKALPHEILAYSAEIAKAYATLGNKEKALEILMGISDDNLQTLRWYLSMNKRDFAGCSRSFYETASLYYQYVLAELKNIQPENSEIKALEVEFMALFQEYENRL